MLRQQLLIDALTESGRIQLVIAREMIKEGARDPNERAVLGRGTGGSRVHRRESGFGTDNLVISSENEAVGKMPETKEASI